MDINYGPNGIIQIDNARIVYRNFAGRGSKFNREGERNFAVVIEDAETAQELADLGWNVKIKPPRDEEDTPFMFIAVKVKFNDRGPIVYLQSGNSDPVRLDEEAVGCIDDIDVLKVDLDIRPYKCVVNGKEWVSAYLHSMLVVQDVDRFAARFDN